MDRSTGGVFEKDAKAFDAAMVGAMIMYMRLNGEQKSTALVHICAWCRKARNDAGRWIDMDVHPDGRRITHGICPDCARKARLEMDRLLPQR